MSDDSRPNPWLEAMGPRPAAEPESSETAPVRAEPNPATKRRKGVKPPGLPKPAPARKDSPADQLDETVEGHAIILARSQATLGEIVASVAEAFALPLKDAAAQVEAIKLSLLVAAHSGRAFLRRRIFDAATGRTAISRDERNLLMTLGRQHLGHTAAGTDTKVRRIVEAAERRALNVAMDGEEAEGEDETPKIDGEDSI